jgi:hypothetical protein
MWQDARKETDLNGNLGIDPVAGYLTLSRTEIRSSEVVSHMSAQFSLLLYR